ncbi:MAG: hypothetical protein WA139_05965 [Candidatus Aenigmatarchaeota archaeon]
MARKRWKKKIATMRKELEEFCESGGYSIDINEDCTNEYGNECSIFGYARRSRSDESPRYWCEFDHDGFYLFTYGARNVREAHALIPKRFLKTIRRQKELADF